MKKYIIALLFLACLSCGDDDVAAPEVNLPEVQLLEITNITNTTATSNSVVSSDGGGSITERGICWNTSPNPTINNSTTSNGNGLGTFISTLNSLSVNTTYYARSFAENSEGIAYSNTLEFNTNLPEVITGVISNITPTGITVGGEVTNEGGTSVTLRGLCWSTSPNPTINDATTTDGSGLGGFVGNINELEVNTTYYIRAYATNSIGTTYGLEVEFNSNLPTVTTTPITNITETSIETGGEVTDEGGTSVTERGVCWSTSPNPTIDDMFEANGLGLGTFTSNLDNLTANSTYYVRAYAINNTGISYGNEIEFNNSLPTVVTSPVTNINTISALGVGEVTDEGGNPVTERGVCWSTSQNPTVNDFFTISGSGLGSFNGVIDQLQVGTTYYVRAYAKNDIGIAYGNEVDFMSNNIVSVTTNLATYLSDATALIEAEVVEAGVAPMIARGVCWSTNPNPTTNNSNLSDSGVGPGIYNIEINGLTANSIYYIRAYVEHAQGIVYGNEIEYTSSPCNGTVSTANTIILTSQLQVDAFNYNSVGGLLIEGADISDLSPLSCLETIDGDTGLTIRNNPNLLSLYGLNNIQYITGYSVDIQNNNSLLAVDNLDSLINFNATDFYIAHIPSYFMIRNNPSLQSIAIPNLSGLVTGLAIENSPNLTMVDLSSVTWFMSVRIIDTPQLTSLNFNSLDKIGYVVSPFAVGLIRISNTNLADLSAFQNMTSGSPVESVSIHNNPNLQNLSGLENGSIYATSVSIIENNSLINVDGLVSVTPFEFGGMHIENNPMLANIDGLSNYQAKNNILINNNDALTNLDALSITTFVQDQTIITNNDALVDLCGLTSLAACHLTQAGGFCQIFTISGNAYNPSAQDIVDGNCSQ